MCEKVILPISTVLAWQTKLNEIIQQEWQHFLLQKALDRLQNIVAPQSISCFQMTIDGVSAEGITDKLGIQLDTVYKIRMRMKSRMLKEVQKLIVELEF